MCLRGVIFKKVRLLALFGRIPHNYNVPIFRAGQMSALLRGHFLLGREMHMDQATYSPLIATKLHIPTYGSDLLHRHQLVEEIDEVGMARVILICAPAGFGKTTAVSQWISSAGKPAGWLSLDESDSDPARFWRYLAKAISAGRRKRAGSLLRRLICRTRRQPIICYLSCWKKSPRFIPIIILFWMITI